MTWLLRLRTTAHYEMAVRVIGGSWYLLLALAGASKFFLQINVLRAADFNPSAWPPVASSACLFLFDLVLFWAMLHRPSPVARTAGLLPSLIAFAGTYLPWTIALFAPVGVSATQNIVSAMLMLVGAVMMVVVIFYLGRCFSIVPQARSLVRTGPYAFVRNPLYLVEEIALLGILIQSFSALTLVLFLGQGVLQVWRIFLEEDLLRRTFPEYDEYAKSTSRLIPYVW